MTVRFRILAALTVLAASLQVYAERSPGGSGSATSDFSSQCLSFRPASLVKNATLTRLEFITSGTNIQFPDNVASCSRPNQTIETNICRIAMSIPTSNRSSFSYELWLPENWVGKRSLSTGNGGIDGCIQYDSLAYGAQQGFAAMGTNNGHNGTTGVTMLNNPDVIKDFSWRALHTGTVVGKRLIQKFYKDTISHPYFMGCSLGGRMGIKAAEMFPEDYDGILAGCPALDFNNLQGWRAMFYPITGAVGSPNFINASLWTGLIHNEILNQCDTIDGVKDGIIEVPDRCFFDPGTLLCGEGEDNSSGTCLNANQTEQLRQIYATYTYPNGTLIYPRNNPGNEILGVTEFFAGKPFLYSQEWFRYVVLNDPDWDPITYTRDDNTLAVELNPFNIRTWPEVLPAFKNRGGKMLTYHGGQDNHITQFNTARFYSRMLSFDPNVSDYYRFIRVSGMNHCSTGPGAWVLGQSGNSAQAGIPFDGSQNVLAAVVEWVEQGRVPQNVLGTKFINDTVSLGIDFQRVACMFPSNSTFIGGDPKLASSWACI